MLQRTCCGAFVFVCVCARARPRDSRESISRGTRRLAPLGSSMLCPGLEENCVRYKYSAGGLVVLVRDLNRYTIFDVSVEI